MPRDVKRFSGQGLKNFLNWFFEVKVNNSSLELLQMNEPYFISGDANINNTASVYVYLKFYHQLTILVGWVHNEA